MRVEKLMLTGPQVIPLIAALPYAIKAERAECESAFTYDPATQLTQFARSRDYSTCRYEESVNPLFGKSRSDTQKDD